VLTPYEEMKAARATASAPRARKVLSPEQRAARKKANSIAARRAIDVLKARHRDEFNALAKAERNALYDRIDTMYAEGQEIVLP